MRLKARVWILLGVLVLGLGTSLLAQAPDAVALEQASIMVDQQKIELEFPLIQRGKTVYFPMRELLEKLGATITYLRKDDVYVVMFKSLNIGATLIPNSRNMMVKQSRVLLSQSTFFHDSVLYVPLDSFVQNLQLNVEKKGQTYTFRTTKEQWKASAINIAPPDFIQDQLPRFNPDQELSLAFESGVYPLKGKFFYQKDTLYAELEDSFSKERYYPEIDGETYTLSKNGTTYTLSTQTAEVVVSRNGSLSKRSLGQPLIKREGRFYFPLVGTAQLLGLSPRYMAAQKVIALQNKVAGAQWVNTKGTWSLVLQADKDLSASAPLINKRQGVVVYEFPMTQVVIPKIPVGGPISQVSVFAEGFATKLILTLKDDALKPLFHSTPSGGAIAFYPVVSEWVEVTGNPKAVQLNLGSFSSVRTYMMENPPRFVVDIDNAICDLPLITQSSSPAFSRIRASQFQVDPAITRIVFDLTSANKPEAQKTEQGWTLRFPVTATLSEPRQPIISKPEPANRPIEGLAGKLIVIDPGHGGSDPGAVAKSGEFEKDFTLDISRRLAKKLGQAGAKTVLERENDENPELSERADQVNRLRPAVFVSVHINSFVNDVMGGTETYYYKYKDKRLAKAIHDEMVHTLGLKDNGLRRSRLYVLRHTKVPAVLVEPVYITNPAEFEQLKQPEFRDKIADAIVRGLVAYFKDLE
ncbi:MAG: N-acetylmuramoyl-L-alanine amidase [Candidatus Margulisiibacteriota bacterium]